MRWPSVALLSATVALSACADPIVVSLPNGGGRSGWTRPAVPRRVDKLDLLFVVDNSSSMADKQRELAAQIPRLLADITAPPTGTQKGQLRDVHVGVITSSLGSHGTSACAVEL